MFRRKNNHCLASILAGKNMAFETVRSRLFGIKKYKVDALTIRINHRTGI